MDPVLRLFCNFLFGTLFVFAAFVVAPGERLARLDWTLLGPAYIGFFEMGITFVLWLKALRLSETTAKVGNLIYLSPFLSLVFIHYLVGEEIRGATLLGLVLIIAGILLQRLPFSPGQFPFRSGKKKTV
jgi:drug/metabolite transporter (DMT)-like permease